MKNKHTQTQIALFSLLMLLIPIHFWYLNFAFNLADIERHIQNAEFYMLIPITYTGSMPYAIVTSLIFMIILILIGRKSHAWQTVILLCILSMGATQAAKSAIKHIFQEPRPYVVHLNENTLPFLGYEKNSFYSQPKNIQFQAISESTKNEIIQNYMQSDRGYSFPSGHTIFAVSWLLLFVGLLPRLGQMILLPIMAIWAAVLYSRVALGMHYPVDLFLSILLSWALHAYLFAKILPRLQNRFQAA